MREPTSGLPLLDLWLAALPRFCGTIFSTYQPVATDVERWFPRFDINHPAPPDDRPPDPGLLFRALRSAWEKYQELPPAPRAPLPRHLTSLYDKDRRRAAEPLAPPDDAESPYPARRIRQDIEACILSGDFEVWRDCDDGQRRPVPPQQWQRGEMVWRTWWGPDWDPFSLHRACPLAGCRAVLYWVPPARRQRAGVLLHYDDEQISEKLRQIVETRGEIGYDKKVAALLDSLPGLKRQQARSAVAGTRKRGNPRRKSAGSKPPGAA